MKIVKYLLLAAVVLSVASCGGGSNGSSTVTESEEVIKINRFEDIVFGTPIEELQQTLVNNSYDYRFLFNTNVNNPVYFEEIKYFATDTLMQKVYNVVHTTYPDLSWLEKELAEAMNRSQELLPGNSIKNYYTLITGTFAYYDRVICTDSFMAINIDQYSVKNMKYFNAYFGMPMYIVNLLDSVYMPVDCMASYAINKIPQSNTTDQSMLDLMIFNGKILYFLDKVLPNTPDSVKLRYTSQQMQWAEANEGNVWGYFVQKNLLYENDYAKIRPFVNEAPNTSAFENSAPRMTDFIGWKIVDRYMNKKDISMEELFKNTDSQKILTDSGYKPKRK